MYKCIRTFDHYAPSYEGRSPTQASSNVKTAHQRKTLTSKSTAIKSRPLRVSNYVAMGKLVIILAFALGTLLMLESVQASDDCRSEGKKGYIYIIKMTKVGKAYEQCSEWYKIGASINPKNRLKTLQTGNPYKLQLVNSFYVSNCKKAEKALKEKWEKFSLGKGGGGTEWFQVKSPLLMMLFAGDIAQVIKEYSPSKAMAEGDNDDNIMIDSENSQIHLQKLLLLD